MAVDVTGFERHRREQAKQKAKELLEQIEAQEQEQENAPAEVGLNGEVVAPDQSIDEMTKKEIMSVLDELNIPYNPRDNKETLKGLLVDGTV